MKFSESFSNIVEALAEFQSAIPKITKNKKVEYYSKGQKISYKYADIADIEEAIKPLKSKYGLFITHNHKQENGLLAVNVVISHKSGEQIEWDPMYFELPTNIKEISGVLTYARRYTLCSALGIAADEDTDSTPEAGAVYEDANKTGKKEPKKKSEKKQQNKSDQNLQEDTEAPQDENDPNKQRKRFFAICGKKKITEKQQKAIVFFFTDKESRGDVTEEEYKDINDEIQQAGKKELEAIINGAIQKKNGAIQEESTEQSSTQESPEVVDVETETVETQEPEDFKKVYESFETDGRPEAHAS